MRSLRDALDTAITRQLIKDIPRARSDGEYIGAPPGPAIAINVDELVNVVLATIRENAA